MSRRINYAKAAPGAMHAMLGLQRYTQESGIEHSLLELVKLRASQINGCAYCLDMHSKDARAAGETEQRIYVLNAWREAPFYSERERAALAWTEEITMISEGVSEEVLEATKAQFSPRGVKATQTVFHQGGRASFLELPVRRAATSPQIAFGDR